MHSTSTKALEIMMALVLVVISTLFLQATRPAGRLSILIVQVLSVIVVLCGVCGMISGTLLLSKLLDSQ